MGSEMCIRDRCMYVSIYLSIYLCMVLPRSVRFFFICSSAARCWCSSACPLCCRLPVARARVKPLRVLDCRSAALVVARASLSDRRSCSHHHLPHLPRRLPVAQCIGILLVLARTCERGCSWLGINLNIVLASALLLVYLLSAYIAMGFGWLASLSQPAGEDGTTVWLEK